MPKHALPNWVLDVALLFWYLRCAYAAWRRMAVRSPSRRLRQHRLVQLPTTIQA
jgi:hypothetical protein